MQKSMFKNLMESVGEMMELRRARKEKRLPKCIECGSEETPHYTNYTSKQDNLSFKTVHFHCPKCNPESECGRDNREI